MLFHLKNVGGVGEGGWMGGGGSGWWSGILLKKVFWEGHVFKIEKCVCIGVGGSCLMVKQR